HQSRSFFLQGVERLKPVSHFLFGVVANRTGIEENEVGIHFRRSSRITRVPHDRGHNLTVRKVHLTAVTFYKQTFFANGRFVCGYLNGFTTCLVFLCQYLQPLGNYSTRLFYHYFLENCNYLLKLPMSKPTTKLE